MCGICGFSRQEPEIDIDSVLRMQASMIHRGPDGEGMYQEAHIALAMRRLSIIDLQGGWQPLYNEDRTLVLVANGEIYNYIELRSELAGRGHRFTTGSDCEAILHLYEDHGAECVNFLRGMFAFALWDRLRQTLLLARDRMGEKPLYLYETQGKILFASELKALLSSGQVPFELDPQGIDLFFHYHYVPEPRTILKGVRKLPAASTLQIKTQGWQVEENKYWRMEDAPPLEGNPVELIRAELDNACEYAIRSDVPVGVALSGGLDSSAIIALASRKYPGKIHAFSVGYSGCPPSDERQDASRLAAYLDLPFHSIEIATSEIVNFFPELVYWSDDPIADIAGYGYYSISKLAREYNVPVLMQGQGGDELFLGYPWVQQALHESMQKYKLWEDGPIRGIKAYINLKWPRFRSRRQLKDIVKSVVGIGTGIKRYWNDRSNPIDQLVFYDIFPDFRMASTNLPKIYGKSFMDEFTETCAYDLFTIPQPWPPLDILITRLICQTYLLENGIAQGDRLSMASSIELRLPLVDYKFVETVIGLRKSHANQDLPYKAWMKSALSGILPDWVLSRRKRGFEPPVRDWHGALFSTYGSTLEDGYLAQQDILSVEGSHQLAKGEFPQGAIMPMSFDALVLEMWCRQFSSIANNLR